MARVMNRGDIAHRSRSEGKCPVGPSVLAFVNGPGPGGVERIALRLVAGWRRDGVPVRLISGLPEGTRWPTLWMTIALVRAIRADRPDILFCPGNSYTLVACLVKLVLGRRCPVILAKISNDLVRRDLPWPIRACYAAWLRIQGRQIDRFAALSVPMARETMARMGVPAGRVHVVPNPVLSMRDLAVSHPADPRASTRCFVAVGRLERQKNYPLMLRAFADATGPDDRLTIFGVGRARGELERLGAALGLGGRVRFAGFCDDVLRELPRHDVLLLSSRYEGQPAVVIEALACGLGIVATRCCTGMAALLDDGALGALVDPDDRAGFARAIRAVRPGTQRSDAAQARARAFTIEAAVPAYRAVFARITAPAATHPVQSQRRFMKVPS